MTTLSISKDVLLPALQLVIGVVERKQTFPILSNVLLRIEKGALSLTATDLEVEMVSHAHVTCDLDEFKTTLPAKKLFDIVKTIPDGDEISLAFTQARATITSGRGRFTLTTLPAEEFPFFEEKLSTVEFCIQTDALKSLISKINFAMASQDVRYFLNGMLFELDGSVLRAVATDGHRLAMGTVPLEQRMDEPFKVIVPRKGITELLRILDTAANEVVVTISNGYFRVSCGDVMFTSKLIEGQFPEYRGVIPKSANKQLLADKSELKNALQSASILCNEKLKSVRFFVEKQRLRLFANNQEQDEAEIEVNIDYDDEPVDIGFNVTYLLDVIQSIDGNTVRFSLIDPSSSVLIEDANDDARLYVVMPMCL